MKRRILALAAGLAIVAAAAPAEAQQAGRARAERDQRARAERNERDRDRDRDRDRIRNDDRRGPAFCRNGQGHPVHGWRWCAERGYGRDDDRYRRDRDRDGRRNDDWYRDDDRWRRDWERVRWDVGFFNPRYRQRELNRRELMDLLGRRSFDRFEDYRRRAGYASAMSGVWSVTQQGYGLQLRSGGRPLALLIDRNRDGRVDEVWVVRRR